MYVFNYFFIGFLRLVMVFVEEDKVGGSVVFDIRIYWNVVELGFRVLGIGIDV